MLNNVLLDTGSGGTIFSINKVASIDITPDPLDPIHRISGVGGEEFVFSKVIDQLEIDPLCVKNFVVEIGAMDYGINMDGIIGIDFLLQTGATIDLALLEIRRD